MSFHSWLGTHLPDHAASHWDKGHFVSACTVCGKAMVKLPGLSWRLRGSAGAQ
jgi:hypothetical protein